MRFDKTYHAIVISVFIFLLSLTQNCVTYQYFGTIKYPSFFTFLFGWLHFGGGGFYEGCIWLANPLYFSGLLLLFRMKKSIAFFLLFISSILELSFLGFENLTMTKSGRIAPIVELSSGYFLWLAAILFAAFSSIYVRIKNNININRNGL